MTRLEELARSILDADERQESREEGNPSRPTLAAQYHELRLAYDALQERHEIRPGMFVRLKKGVSPLSGFRSGQPVGWIVVRMLDLDNESDYLIVADRIKNSPVAHHGLGFDCIIATTTDDNDIIVMEPVHSSTLIPISDDEAAAS